MNGEWRCDHDILNITPVIRKIIYSFYPLLPSIRCVFKFHCTFEKGISMVGPPFQPVFWQHQGWHTKSFGRFVKLELVSRLRIGLVEENGIWIKWYLSGVPYSWQCKKGPCRELGWERGHVYVIGFSSITEKKPIDAILLPTDLVGTSLFISSQTFQATDSKTLTLILPCPLLLNFSSPRLRCWKVLVLSKLGQCGFMEGLLWAAQQKQTLSAFSRRRLQNNVTLPLPLRSQQWFLHCSMKNQGLLAHSALLELRARNRMCIYSIYFDPKTT